MKPYDVGYRLMTANLSDIGFAMGGTPRQIVLSVAAPEYVDTAILDEVYRGIKDQCAKYLNILGGDTVRTEGPMVWTVTIIGDNSQRNCRMRSGAQVGDVVGVTNYVGYLCQVWAPYHIIWKAII